MSIAKQSLVVLVAAAAGTVFWSGCGPKLGSVSPFPGGIDSTPPLGVVSTARAGDYDASHGAGDYRRLMVGSCPACRYGPHVLFSPERSAWRYDSAALAEGRFLGRLINFDADSYPKFNLAPHDTVYWWVDRRGPGGTWRSVYVSSLPRRTFTTEASLFAHEAHLSSSPWGRSLARFLWRDRDEALWVACDMTGCCRSSGADLY